MDKKDNFKIAVVGIEDDTNIFKLHGVDAFPVNNSNEAVDKLLEIIKDTKEIDGEEVCNYGIVFITENFAKKITDKQYHKIQNNFLPAIIPIPSQIENNQYGLYRLSRIVEKAVGINLLK